VGVGATTPGSGARAFFHNRGLERSRLESFLDNLAADPMQRPEHTVKDSTGRENRVLSCGQWRVVYWLDDFVKEVRIVSVERVLH
jgi:hypothetical protein